ncbi:hypothetical protein pEaSNUABM37_00326 [Erwinia phage pEa_SNUABM_37]|nr:hypothetical protein pEaSNUABM37_00326 [Erwinia phage pEa_SNUABM_37]QXO10794.1 hypothetical protein pEaSNUABM48_00326 [Erwinia phage pEa_SNUABM_48]
MVLMNPNDVKNNVIATRAMSEIPATLREELVVFGLARLIAYGTVIPSNPVENPVAFFAENSKTAKGVIAVVNESTVVNVSKVVEMAATIYRGRYDMVHSPLTKDAQQLAMQSLIAASQYNFPQAIADTLSLSEDSTDLARSVAYALNMFAVSTTPSEEAAAEAE